MHISKEVVRSLLNFHSVRQSWSLLSILESHHESTMASTWDSSWALWPLAKCLSLLPCCTSVSRIHLKLLKFPWLCCILLNLKQRCFWNPGWKQLSLFWQKISSLQLGINFFFSFEAWAGFTWNLNFGYLGLHDWQMLDPGIQRVDQITKVRELIFGCLCVLQPLD